MTSSASLPTDLRPVIAEALHAYELAQASHLREMSEQHRAAALVAAIDQTENAARTLLERAGLAHIAGAPASLDGMVAPERRADQKVAAAFTTAQTARIELRAALLRLAAAYADGEHWDDVRRMVQPLLDDPQAPLYPDARDLLCLSHYAPALAALAAENWDAARQGFEVVLKLNAAYRDAPSLQRETYLRPARAALKVGAWANVRQLAEAWRALQPSDAEARDLLCESYYAPAAAALTAQQWDNAFQDFDAVLKLNANYRDAAKQHRTLVERAERERCEAKEQAERFLRELAERAERERREAEEQAEREQIAAVQQQIKAGAFNAALDQIEALVKQLPTKRDAVVLAALIAETPAAPRPQRLRAGELAGTVGDPRTPITIADWQRELGQRNEQFGKPSGYFCYVRPGTYRIGGWEKDQPVADITLPAFWLSRFPVTVAQYAPFVTAGYGPDAHRWWTQQGWSWKGNRTTPNGWGVPEYSGPNQPVIGVTWYEATAFCTWLTAQMSDELPSGHVVRLPSEAEWEAAAAYDAQMQRQPYPWGAAALDLDRAIYGATRPAPVGCCPAGAAACGAMDLIGNVWESMASSYAAYPSQSAVLRKDFTPQESDVPWRGGAWNDNGTNVRCGARGGNVLGNVDVGGFRVVLAPRLRE